MNKVSKSILSAFIFAFGLPLMGQVAVYVFPQKRQIAVNGIQTFTAVVTGASNKGISWSASCGNIIKGLNSTIGLKNGTQQDCTVTATSIADKTKSASGAVSYVASPHFQEGIHPRLLLTPAMVETMRTGGWATAANPYWKNGLAKTAANAVAEVDAKWCFSFGGYCPPGSKRGQPMHFTYKQSGPAGVSAADGALSFSCGRLNGDTWCDTGGYKTPIFDATETYTELFAFLSLIDPNATNQEHYRIRAHDMMMWMINLAGDTTQETCTASAHHAPSTPFHNCAFPINDRAHQAGMEAFPLTVDWIYSAFTPSEKKKITHVFRWWAHQCITTSPTGIPYPLPFGVMNDPVLLSNPKRLRWLMNNLGDLSLIHISEPTRQ